MRIERFEQNGGDAASLARRVRDLVPGAASVSSAVAEILEAVRTGGDTALADLVRRLDTDGADPPPLLATRGELEQAASTLDPAVRDALETAVANVGEVARAAIAGDREVALPAGQRILLREVPVRRAAIYVPGGRAPYPSTVVMGAVAARAAGVEDVVVATPPGPDRTVHPAILAACSLCEVDEVVRAGGAHAIAALAYGTDTVRPVDVIAGPGNLYVQEAKRQVADTVGIDGFAGPSDLLVVLGRDAPIRPAALDLLAQAEHGAESLVAAVGADQAALDALAGELEALAAQRDSVAAEACALVSVPDLGAALAFAEEFAPEHLELMGADAEALAPRVRSAGCLFVGAASGTAFGDYLCGSNHILPTDGAARFASGLSPRHFRRLMAQVEIGPAAAALAPPGAALARAEGFVVHAESMEARIGDNGGQS